MRHLGKLAAVAVAAVALIAPAAAQADPGIYSKLSDGSVEFVGKTTCSWANVATNDDPPRTVTVTAAAASNAISCTGGYWGNVNADLVVDFDDTAGTATVRLVDVTGGAFFFWCRYVKSNVVLNRVGTSRTYTGSYSVALHSSNAPSACSNPATVNATVTFK